jgi:hypothetical protein
LHDSGLKPLRELKELEQQPEDKVLIVFGETDVLDKVPGGLVRFIQNGGAALVATDRQTSREKGKALEPFGVWVDGRLVSAPFQDNYKGLEECVSIEFVSDLGRPTIFTPDPDKPRVATNRSSFLHAKVPGLSIQATFPPTCWFTDLDASGKPVAVERPLDPLRFAAAGEIGSGRIIVLADHSVFINEMLWQLDIQNLDFAYSSIDWLTGRKRTRALFFDEGEIQTSFDVPLKDLPAPPLPSLENVLRTVNRGLKGLEEENKFNGAIDNAINRLIAPRLLILALTVGLGIVGLSRLSLKRHRSEPNLPLLATGLVAQQAHAPALAQRHEAMKQAGSYYEPARALARQFFEAAGDFDFAAPGADEDGATVPDFQVAGTFWQRWLVRGRLRRLWRLAQGDEPMRVSRRRLLRLARNIDGLSGELASGRLRITRA